MRPLNILFVDDDQLILNAVRRSLRSEAFAIHATIDPHDVSRLITALGIDVVVSDYVMPAMSGVELLRLVRRLHPDVVRVILTGQAREHKLEENTTREGVADHYLVKPWSDDALRSTFLAIAQARCPPSA